MPQNKNKNIIQIIPNMEIGGAEKTVLEIGSFLKNTSYKPIVLTSGGRMVETLKKEGIKVLIHKIDQKNRIPASQKSGPVLHFLFRLGPFLSFPGSSICRLLVQFCHILMPKMIKNASKIAQK